MSHLSQQGSKRRLVAMMFTDIVGYSALASRDERLAFELLEEHRAIVRRIVPNYGGHENKTIGDAFFIEFGSAVDALQCAIEIQTSLYERNAFVPEEKKVLVRIGLHLGDVIEHEGDTFGDGVNIAARVEGLALAGGIAMTRQVLDQIAGKVEIPLKRIGRIELKNIGAPTDIYRVVFPWEKKDAKASGWSASVGSAIEWGQATLNLLRGNWEAGRRQPVARLRAFFLALQVISACVVVGVTVYLTQREVPRHVGRAPASLKKEAPRLSLIEGWKWLPGQGVDTAHKALEQPESGWAPFDILKPWKHANEVLGSYWLKKSFDVPAGSRPVLPAVVLGPIQDRHRVYLNGRFIGGSQYGSSIEYYSFDSDEIREGENVLLVHAWSRPTLVPGLSHIPEIGTFLGEFDTVFSAVMRDRLGFHVLRSIYLAVSFLIAAACIVFFLWHRGKRQFLYYGLYLMLGAILLAYYNLLVSSATDYRFQRFAKAFALSLSSFVLLSSHLARKKKELGELANNAATVALGALVAGLSFLGSPEPSHFIHRYNGVLSFSLVFTLAWTLAVGASIARLGFQRIRGRRRPSEENAISWESIWSDGMVVGFGAVQALLIYASLKTDFAFMNQFSPEVESQPWLLSLGRSWMGYPFVFAVCLLGFGIFDYALKSRSVIYKRKRDELILEIIRVASEAPSVEGALEGIQRLICDFVRAERSTLYLLEEGKLKAASIHGPPTTRHFVSPTLSAEEGIFGHVCSSKAPLLIENIRTDLRFAQFLAQKKGGASSYKTGSCMVFPLTIGGELHGVLTFADRRGGAAFSRDDFALLHVVSKNLALIISNARLKKRAAA